jgi:hypothetical protein
MARWYAGGDSSDEHAIYEELIVYDDRIGYRRVAVVEAFSEAGPFYANAVDSSGNRQRLGAGVSLKAARAWAERIAGVTPPKEFEAPQP